MIGYSILNNVFNKLLSGGLVEKVYHDVIIIEKTNNRYPAYPKGKDYIEVGVDDTKIMNCYFRQTGDMRNVKTEFISGCGQMYTTKVPYRMVLFNDYEKRNFDQLNAAFVNAIFEQSIEFTALITDRKKIQTEENLLKNFTFDARTYYIAIDFLLTLQVYNNNCVEVIGCDEIPNPVCAVKTISTLCAAPVLLSVTEITTSQALIAWFSVANATSYNVYYKKHSSTQWIFAATLYDALNYLFTGLEENTLYDYKVRANCSEFSQSDFTTSGTDLLHFRYGWSDIEFGDGTGGTIDKTTFNYQYTGTFSPGGDLVTQFVGMPNNVFIAVEYPDTEADKTTWENTEANYGEIPDFVMENISAAAGNKYILSRIEMTLDNAFTTTFS